MAVFCVLSISPTPWGNSLKLGSMFPACRQCADPKFPTILVECQGHTTCRSRVTIFSFWSIAPYPHTWFSWNLGQMCLIRCRYGRFVIAIAWMCSCLSDTYFFLFFFSSIKLVYGYFFLNKKKYNFNNLISEKHICPNYKHFFKINICS